MSKSVLLSVLNRDDKYPKMFDISAPYCCGAISLQCAETYTNQMLEELPNITFNIYTLQDDKYVLYESRALSIVVPNNANPISMALIDIPTSCILAITPEFDDYAFCSHNAEVNTSGGEKWLTPTTEFPIQITWDNTNIVADTGGSAPADTYTKEEINEMLADKVSDEELLAHFIAGSNIEIVDNLDGTQTINASGEVSSEDVVARAEIAAIKDGETLDSFSDVETALTTKQDTLTTAQLAAVNSGIDSTDVAQITTNTDNISTIQQTIGNINQVLEEVL